MIAITLGRFSYICHTIVMYQLDLGKFYFKVKILCGIAELRHIMQPIKTRF